MAADKFTRTSESNFLVDEYKVLQELRETIAAQRALIVEQLTNEDWIELDQVLMDDLSTSNKYLTKDKAIKGLQDKYKALETKYYVLLKSYNEHRNRSLIQRIFNT